MIRRPSQDPRAGFTVLEMVLAIAVAGILFGIGFGLMQMGNAMQTRALREADAAQTTRNVVATLKNAVHGAARSAVSSPDLSAVRVSTGGADNAERDTLLLVEHTGPALRVASRTCRSGSATCLALLGDQSAAVSSGGLFLVGSASIGYRLLQATATPVTFAASCGADCPSELLCPVVLGPIGNMVMVTGAVTTGGTASTTCTESYYPDGRQCVENRSLATTPATVTPTCQTRRPNSTFTEVVFQDRSAAVGLHTVASWAAISGSGTPAVSAIPANVERYRLVAEAGEQALVRDPGLGATGAWRPAVRVAGPVAAMRVETMHRGQATFVRGDQMSAGLLQMNASNANFDEDGGRDSEQKGYVFNTGYQNIVGLRLRIDAVGRGAEGVRTTEPIWIVHGLTQAAAGGAREEP